jgi:aspartyl-tRNA synthetase
LQHDLVLNGFEVGGGSIRIHQSAIQEKVWDLIGFSAEQKKMFSHMIEAFSFGVPPHGGIAPGLDRLLMVLAGEKNLREVTAFPLTSDGRDPMMSSPSEVSKEQLEELGLEVKKK